MRNHIANAAYGVLDYVAFPAAMLLAAPVLLHRLGAAQYGVWVVAAAAVSAGGIIASGFGDANIQYVASVRGRGDNAAMLRAVRSLVGINLLLGGSLALASWIFAPLLARHIVSSDLGLRTACVWSLRIAGVLMLVRSIESVCISTQRAFERYGAAVRISVVARLLTQAAAVALAIGGRGVIDIMAATAFFMVVGTVAQLARLRQHLGETSLLPAFDRDATAALIAFGTFSWLQAVSSVIFSHADRLVLGVSLGATVVASYALCVQMAQPIYGIASAALHFLFPYLSSRADTASIRDLAKKVLIAFGFNALIVIAGTATVLLLGREVLHLWVGEAIAQSSTGVLAPIVWSFALLGLNVTGYYAMLALGHVRAVTWLNLAGGALMLAVMVWLLPRLGIRAVAMARVCYGAISLLLYYPLVRHLRSRSNAADSTLVCNPVWEEA